MPSRCDNTRPAIQDTTNTTERNRSCLRQREQYHVGPLGQKKQQSRSGTEATRQQAHLQLTERFKLSCEGNPGDGIEGFTASFGVKPFHLAPGGFGPLDYRS
jgi:hypothetical protein